MESKNIRHELTQTVERFRDPVKLRLLITGLLLAVGYVGIYLPLSTQMDETARSLVRERNRQALASDIEYLRAQVEMFQSRLPEKSDVNEWVQYVLDGTRKFPLKLINLDSDKSKRVGPFEAVSLRVSLQGEMKDLDSFLHWVEANERLIRVDSAKLDPDRGAERSRIMKLTLLGLKA